MNLHRGLPQGAPESPITFVMILDCVVRRCERKLGTAGLGFLATRAEEASASCAGDIFLISTTKKDLESMIALELQNVGLCQGANRTQRSSYPGKPGAALKVDEEQISGNLYPRLLKQMGSGKASEMQLTGASVRASVLWGQRALDSDEDGRKDRLTAGTLEQRVQSLASRRERCKESMCGGDGSTGRDMQRSGCRSGLGGSCTDGEATWFASRRSTACESIDNTISAMVAVASMPPQRQVDRTVSEGSRSSGGKINRASGTVTVRGSNL